MRVNLARTNKNLQGLFFEQTLRDFADEFGFTSYKAAGEYVRNGKQGLQSYVDYLKSIGYAAELYFLPPNKELFQDVGDNWIPVSRTSPSFGFTIPDNDPLLVEFKLKNS
jgi:hypothetical protein